MRRTQTKKARKFRGRKKNTNMRKQKVYASLALGFPKKMQMTHKWTTIVPITTSASGVVSTIPISCNSMTQPDPSVAISATFRPIYFDKMISVYEHYCVIGSKIKVRFLGDPSNVGSIISITQNSNTTSPVAPHDILVQTQNTHKVLEYGLSQTDSAPILVSKWSSRKTFGKGILNNDNAKGDGVNNPEDQYYFLVGVSTVDPLSPSQLSFMLVVEVEYIAVWFELDTENMTTPT